jgi:hypothetical protein
MSRSLMLVTDELAVKRKHMIATTLKIERAQEGLSIKSMRDEPDMC